MVFCEVFLLHSISNAELLTKLISIGLVCVYCVRKGGQLAGLWIWGYDAGYEAEALPAKVGLPNFEEPGRGGKGGRGGEEGHHCIAPDCTLQGTDRTPLLI